MASQKSAKGEGRTSAASPAGPTKKDGAPAASPSLPLTLPASNSQQQLAKSPRPQSEVSGAASPAGFAPGSLTARRASTASQLRVRRLRHVDLEGYRDFSSPMISHREREQIADEWRKERIRLLTEIHRLQLVISKQGRELVEITSQRDSAVGSLEDLKQQYQKMGEQLRHKVEFLEDRNSAQAMKLENSPFLDNFIAEFYLELMPVVEEKRPEEHSDEKKPDPTDSASQALETPSRDPRVLLKQKTPLALLDELRRHLRATAAAQAEERARLTQALTKLSQESAASSRHYEARLAAMEAKVQANESCVFTLNHEHEISLAAAKEDLASQLHAMQAELKAAQAEVVRSQAKHEASQALLLQRDELLLPREQRLARVQQLEDTLEKLSRDHHKEIVKLKTVSSREKAQQDRQARVHSKTDAENRDLSQQVSTLRAQLKSAKVEIARFRGAETEQLLEHALQREKGLRLELAQSAKKTAALEATLEEISAKNEKMREEYTLIFDAAARDYKRKSTGEEEAKYWKDRAVFLEEKYFQALGASRDKLDGKDRECEQLRSRVQKLYLLRRWERIHFEQERQQQQLASEASGSPRSPTSPARHALPKGSPE
eukprot:RCo034291